MEGHEEKQGKQGQGLLERLRSSVIAFSTDRRFSYDLASSSLPRTKREAPLQMEVSFIM